MAVLQEEKENIFDKFNVDNYFKAQDERVQKQIENEQKYCHEIVSPDKIKEWQDKGQMSALEVWNRKNKWDLLPYKSAISEGHKLFKIKHISDQLRQGSHISPEDRELFNQFVTDLAEVQTRGYTWGGKTVQMGLDTLPFMAEFGLGLLTTGGTASFGATATRAGVKKALAQVTKNIANNVAKDGMFKATMKGIGKTAVNATLNPHTYEFALTRLPQQVWHTFEDMRVSDSLAVTPEGQAILKESEESPALAFFKALAMTNIEIASEMSGQLIFNPMLKGLDKVFAKPILRAMPKTLKEGLIKLSRKVTGLPFTKAVDNLGWNGLLEEIGEERVGDLLETTFNLDDKEGYSFEQFLDAMFPNISQGFGAFASEFASELVSFGVTGMGAHAMHSALNNNQKYTKDGFLVDAGIFKSPFGRSALDKKLEKTLKEKSNLSEDDIQNVLNFATRDDKVQFLRNNGAIDDEQIKNINKLRENYYNQFKNANVDDDTAISTATVYADTIAMTAHDLGMDVDELNKQFGIKAQNLSDNEAYNQYQNDNIATLRGRVEENVYKNESDKTLKQVQGDWVNEYAKEHPEVLNDDELLFQPMDSAGAGVNENYNQNKEYYNIDGTMVEDSTNPLDYDYIHTQFKSVPKEQQEKIKLEINPELKGRENEIVKPIEIKNYIVKTQSDSPKSVAREIKQKLFNATGRDIQPIKVINKNTNEKVYINAGSINESTKEILKGTDKNLVATVLLNAQNIFENSELIFSNNELKDKELKDKQIIQRYATIISYNNEPYLAITTLKNNSKNKTKPINQPEISVYHIAGYEMNNGTELGNHNIPKLNTAKISITDLVNFVKSRVVERYNNDYNSATNNIPQSDENITPNQANVTKHEDNNIQFQSMTKEQLLNVYMNQEFGMSADDITDMVTEDIKNILTDYDVSEDEFKFEDIRIYGSYSKGTNKVGSDLDIVVQYSGSLKEDSAFNMLHDEELSIYDKKGNKVKIDINPINTADHGTIDEYSKILFQSAAMYKDKFSNNASDFYNNVQNNFNNFKTAKYSFKTVKLSLPADTIRHDLKHELSADNWQEIEDNIDNIYIANKINDTSAYGDNLYNFGIKTTTGNYYYLCIAINNKDNLIVTAAKNTKKGVDSYVTGKGKTLSKVPNALPPVAPFSKESSTNIINYIKEKLNPNVTEHEDRNLIMAHASKSSKIDDVIDSGALVAPSFSITSKESDVLNEGKFGDILFIRNPKKINYTEDNIYDRDIYSPRMPMPHYDIPDGRTVDYYEYDSLKRSYENNPERFVEKWGETFDDMFKDAKKVLFLGYTSSGNRRYVPYTNENILKQMKKEGLLAKEGFDYGLSSMLAKFSKKQTSKSNLKETAKKGLGSDKDLNQKWEDIKQEYDELGDKVAEYYYDKYDFYRVQSEAFYYIAKNQIKKLEQEFDMSDIPAGLIKEVKEFVEKAKNLPRSYFEAKPMKEVSLSEFSYALTQKDVLTQEQKQKLKEQGVEVVEYEKSKLSETLAKLDEKSQVYFQDNEQGNSTEENIKGSRGFTYQRETAPNVIENIIVLLNNKADKSTLLHEFGHVYLQVMNDLARTNSKARERVLTIDKWLRHEQGSEYTTAQHEKFARGFVAYVKQGKAPNYSLKKAFEHFKKWLGDIRDILEANNEADIDIEGMSVFDEILGGNIHDENLEIAKELYQDAIRYSQIKWAQEEDKQKKQAYFKEPELTEWQKRYRDTAYDIIFKALQNTPEGRELVKNMNQLRMILGTTKGKTYYSKRNKSLKTQSEQIAKICANCGDALSRDGRGLAHDEWSEFFKPISEDYTDEDLAIDAYDCIVQEDYLKRNDATDDPFADYYGDFYEGIVEESQYILDYLIDEYKNAEDKTIPLLAWNEFHSHIHEYIREDFEKKWENATAEIDRYQSLSQMQQAKEDLKIHAEVLKGQGDFHNQFRDYAKSILKRLDFMTESDKEKVLSKIMEFNSFRDVEQNLDEVMDFAETLQQVTERRMIADDIRREVKETIHEWKNGIKKTKYTYPANKLFERLRELNKMSDEDIENLYAGFEEYTLDYTSDDVNDEDFYKTIEKMFIQYRVNGRYYNSTAFLQDLLNKIQDAKFTAKLSRDEIDFERRMHHLNLVDECKNALDERRKEIDKNGSIKFMADLNSIGFNFNGALRMIFNDKIKGWASLDYLYAKRDGQVGKDRREFLDKAKELFGYKGKRGDFQLQSKFIDMTKKEFTITQYHSPDIVLGNYRVTENNKETGYNSTVKTEQLRQNNNTQWKPFTLELSRMELLYFYIQAKNPVSYKILTDADKGQFNQIEFDNLLEELTPQERLLGDIMQMSAEKYWDGLNAYHIKKYHVELGKVKNYFPRLTEQQEVNMLEMFNDYTQYSGNGKFQKQRTAGAGTRIAPANALAVLFDHMEKANTVVIMGEHLDTINKVFKNPDLKREITNIWGDKVAREFYGQLAGNLFGGQTEQKSIVEQWQERIINNLIKVNIFAKPQIGIKQLISFMNYGKGDEYVSAKEWWTAFAKQTFSPAQWKKNIEFMMSNEYMADRFSRGGSMDALKKQLDNKFYAKLNLLDDIWSMPVALGDIGAIILGGKPYIDVLMAKGYSKEDAFKIFIETTVNDQQSSIPSTLSNAQRNSGKNPFAKLFFAYQNTPWQYYRQCTSAIMNAVQSGKGKDILKAGKMIVLYGWLFPAVFNMVSSLSLIELFTGGGDDEPYKDLLSDINPLRTLTSLLTQHPIVGDWIKGSLNAIDGKPFYSNDLIGQRIKQVNKLISHIKKDEVTFIDVFNAISAIEETFIGQPLGAMSNAVSGVYDITQGDFMKGTIKALGYSEHRANKVTNNEEK